MNAPHLTIAEQKRALRQVARARNAEISSADRVTFSEQVAAQLCALPAWQQAERVLGYLALRDELDVTRALEAALRAGKTVALPRYIPEESNYGAALITESFATLQPGEFGILEPSKSAPLIPLNQLDFILVPGVAFDSGGRRLGRGKGFYDRLLANVSANCIKCGIAADEQIVTGIPAEPHDIAVDIILTPTRCLAMAPD